MSYHHKTRIAIHSSSWYIITFSNINISIAIYSKAFISWSAVGYGIDFFKWRTNIPRIPLISNQDNNYHHRRIIVMMTIRWLDVMDQSTHMVCIYRYSTCVESSSHSILFLIFIINYWRVQHELSHKITITLLHKLHYTHPSVRLSVCLYLIDLIFCYLTAYSFWSPHYLHHSHL